MEIKGIILDYGGTLDTGGDHWSHVIKEGWDKAGVAANDALFREAYVYGEQEIERTEHILPQHDFSDLLKIKIELELTYLASHGEFPPAQIEAKSTEIAAYCYGVAKEATSGSKDILEKLSSKYPLVLVSNFYGNLSTVLKDFGLYNFFKEVIESKKVGVKKPDVEIFTLALKALTLKPEEVLVVGDSVKNDILPAKKLGCQTLLLKGRGWAKDAPLPSSDIQTIESLDEVFNFIA